MATFGSPYLIILCLTSILAVAAIGGGTVAGETGSFVLGADPALVVDGHHYAVVAVDLGAAESLRVGMHSTEVDSFLTLIAPDQSLHDDDQSGGGSDAQVEIDAPMPGLWLIVATTYAPDETGRVELAIEPGIIADAATVTLPEAVSHGLIARRGARAEAAWISQDLAQQEADISELTNWLVDVAQRDAIGAIISDKLTKLRAERGRLQIVLAAGTVPSGTAEVVDPTDGSTDTDIERELLLEAVAEIEALEMGLEAAATALAEIGALETVVAGGKGIQWVIQELVAETKVNREGFDSIDAMLQQRRETLAWRLVAGDVVVLGERGPMPSDDDSMPINMAIDRQRYLDDTVPSTKVGPREGGVQVGGNLNNLTLVNRNTGAAIGKYASAKIRIGASADVGEGAFVPRGADPMTALMPRLHPWPPPAASTHTDLQHELIDPERDPGLTLGDVDKRITTALADAGYAGHSYSGVPGGFAIATPVERFAPDGSPLDPTSRWSTKLPPLRSFSLTEYIRALFTAEAGHFRVLLFVVTDQPFRSDSARARLSTVRTWARQGVVRLPKELRDQAYTPDHGTTVLVYEFEKVRASSVAQVVFEDLSMLAPAHLRSAGILRALGGS